MELTQLEELVAIAQYGTMSAAAEALHISQPAISRSINQLERELGEELFTRTKNHAELNETGQLVLEDARKVLADVQLLRDHIDEHAKRLRTVRIGSCAPAPIWELTQRITTSFPGTILSTERMNERDLERALLNREVDLAVLRRPLGLPTVLTRQMMTESLSVMVPPDDELASKEHLSWDDINGRSFLILDNIGLWMDITREHLPDSQLVVQNDNVVFQQLINTSDLLHFVTNFSTVIHDENTRIKIPIWDTDASQTFFLACSTDATDTVKACLELF